MGKRRAEDSEDWSEYLNEQINWSKSFETLGEYFTIRILLRRELFTEIERWLKENGDNNIEEKDQILSACELTLKSLNEKKESGEKLDPLNHVVEMIRSRL